MPESKSQLFSEAQNQVARIAKALGHPARIAILEILSKQEGCFCGEIVDLLPLSQSTVSQHLKALKQVGLVKGYESGTAVCYCIDQTNWQHLSQLLQQFMSQKRCC